MSCKILVTAFGLLCVFSFIVILNKKNTKTLSLSGMAITDLHEHTLEQAEVDEVIGVSK